MWGTKFLHNFGRLGSSGEMASRQRGLKRIGRRTSGKRPSIGTLQYRSRFDFNVYSLKVNGTRNKLGGGMPRAFLRKRLVQGVAHTKHVTLCLITLWKPSSKVRECRTELQERKLQRC